MMPELPEVEVTRRCIAPFLVGRTVSAVHTTQDSYFFLTPPHALRRALLSLTACEIARRGKYLVILWDDESRLVLHLGMTGQLFSSSAASVRLLSATARAALSPEEQFHFRPDAHTHLRLCFKDSGPEVLLRDARKFGKVLYLRRGEDHVRLQRLGIDALELCGEDLFRISRKRSLSVKGLLLDQAAVAGIGNIYADEALFRAGVKPSRRAGRLTRGECDVLVEALQSVLLRSIATGGSSISDFVAPDGKDGHYQDERQVYAREGEACGRCGAVIRKRRIAQRGTHFCPRCQK